MIGIENLSFKRNTFAEREQTGRLRGNEEGFVMITSILVLIVLTLVGTAMFNTSVFETMIAGSERRNQERFFSADAGINAVLAEDSIPSDSFLPSNFTSPFVNCNEPGGQLSFAGFDLDGDGTDDVSVYLLQKFGNPPEIRVASCAVQGNTTGEILAGIQYGAAVGGTGGTGDVLEY